MTTVEMLALLAQDYTPLTSPKTYDELKPEYEREALTFMEGRAGPPAGEWPSDRLLSEFLAHLRSQDFEILSNPAGLYS